MLGEIVKSDDGYPPLRHHPKKNPDHSKEAGVASIF